MTSHQSDLDGVQPAGVGQRLAARLIDLAVSIVLAFVFVIPVSIVLLPLALLLNSTGHREVWGAIGGGISLLLAFVMVEWVLLVRRQGQTLGKGLLGLRVVSDITQENLTMGQAAIRMLVLLVPNYSPIALLAWVINLVAALVDRPRGRAVHDLAARSRVVRAPKRPVNVKADLLMAMPVPQKVNLTKGL
ncbi:RDD family protein [Geodermatophilus sp. SYSU D01180]